MVRSHQLYIMLSIKIGKRYYYYLSNGQYTAADMQTIK